MDLRLRGLNVQLMGDCVRSECQLNEHKTCINEVYEQFNEIVIDSGGKRFGYLRPSYKQVPGWNEYVKSHHAAYRECFLRWKREGCPRQGSLATSFRSLRAKFKLSLRWCKANKVRLKTKLWRES